MARDVVLIIRDDSVRHPLANELTAAGLHVTEYPSVDAFRGDPSAPECIIIVSELQPSWIAPQTLLKLFALDWPRSHVILLPATPQTPKVLAEGCEFVEKPVRAGQILEAISRLEVPLHFSEELLREKFQALSTRENEILEAIAAGMSSMGMAQQLGLSLFTVQRYRGAIKKNASVRDIGELMRMWRSWKTVLAERSSEPNATCERMADVEF